MKISTISSITKSENFCKQFFNDISPFISFDFFEKLELSASTNLNSGWIPEHLILEEKNKIVGFIPNFRKLNSNGEYVFDHIFANAYNHIGQKYYPKYLSAIPFTPVTKQRFIYGEKNMDKLLYQDLINFFKKKNVSSFHVNFLQKKSSEVLKKYGFTQRVGIQYYWRNKSYTSFDCFLNNLKSKKKKNIIKERKFLKSNNVNIKLKQGDKITKKDITLLYNCYLNTINKKWSIPYIKLPLFFLLLDTSIKEKMIVIQAYNGKEFLGCSLHFVGKDTLYGRYWGCLTKLPFLHFELCYYSAIEFAIENKIKKIEAGAQGEHKIPRGYVPELTYSNHWFSNDDLRVLIDKFLIDEKGKVIDTLNFLKKYIPFKE